MQSAQRLTAIIEREDDGFVASCPELDIASQGTSVEEARVNPDRGANAVFRNGGTFRGRPPSA